MMCVITVYYYNSMSKIMFSLSSNFMMYTVYLGYVLELFIIIVEQKIFEGCNFC